MCGCFLGLRLLWFCGCFVWLGGCFVYFVFYGGALGVFSPDVYAGVLYLAPCAVFGVSFVPVVVGLFSAWCEVFF